MHSAWGLIVYPISEIFTIKFYRLRSISMLFASLPLLVVIVPLLNFFLMVTFSSHTRS